MKLYEIYEEIDINGIENLNITSDIADDVNCVMNICNTFSRAEYRNILYGFSCVSGQYDNECYQKYMPLANKDVLDIYLKKIYEKDGNFENLKEYMKFREDNSGMDYAENLILSTYEYSTNYDLISDILENIQGLDEHELAQLKNKFNGLMQMGNPFGIKKYDELQNSEEIESRYYSNIEETIPKEIEQKKLECIKQYIKEQFGDESITSYKTRIFFEGIESFDEYEQLENMAIIIEKMKGHDVVSQENKSNRDIKKEFYFDVLKPLNMDFKPKEMKPILEDGNFNTKDKTENPKEAVENTIITNMSKLRIEKSIAIKEAISGILVQDTDINKILQLANSRNNDMINNSKLNDILNILNNVNETTDFQRLTEMFKASIAMIGTPELEQMRMDSQNIYEKLKEEYRNEYVSKASKYESMSSKEIEQIEGVSVRKENGIKIVELSGAPFKCMAHNGYIDRVPSARCCTSYISNKRCITFDENASNGYLFNSLNEKDIKLICPADDGFSSSLKIKNQFITPESMDSTYLSDGKSNYTEIQIATGIEKARKDNKERTILPSAIFINSKGTLEKGLNLCQNEKIDTLYVIHDDLYKQRQEEKNNDIDNNLDMYVDDYLKSMDVDKLNDILIYAGKDNERLKNVFQKISDKTDEMRQNDVKVNVDSTILRRNLSRFEELNRYKIGENLEEKKGIYNLEGYIRNTLSSRNNEKGIDANWLKNQISNRENTSTYDISTLQSTYQEAGIRTEQVENSMQDIRKTNEMRKNQSKGINEQDLGEEK